MDDKKKKLALIGLVVVIAGVGAFQFTSGGAEPTKATVKKEEKNLSNANKLYATDPNTTDLIVASALPARDPFDGSSWQPKPEQPKVVPPPPPAQSKQPRPFGGRNQGGSIPPFKVDGLPLPGDGGNVKLEPGKAMPDPSAFGYSVSGVIVGHRPAAVFTDANGNQRLVPVGGSIDGDSQVVGVSKGKVTIRHRDKTITMTVGGTQ